MIFVTAVLLVVYLFYVSPTYNWVRTGNLFACVLFLISTTFVIVAMAATLHIFIRGLH